MFWGGLATLFSKEYFIYWVDTAEQFAFLALVVAATKMYGKQIGEFLDKGAEQENAEAVKALQDQTKGFYLTHLIINKILDI